MHRYDYPGYPVNPYPPAGTQIAAFRYDTALVLLRLKDAVPLRSGEDADYIVGRPFEVSWQPVGGDWQQITVPEGLITDLTSVPVLLRWVVGRVGPWLEAAIVHDYLYIAWQDDPDDTPRRADRRFADDIMLAAMRAAKVTPLRAWAIHKMVTLFGGTGFRMRSHERYVDISDADISGQIAPATPRPETGKAIS